MPEVTRFDLVGYGEVVVEHPKSWKGRAIVRWENPDAANGQVERKIPAQLLVELSRKIARRSVRNEVIDFLKEVKE
jgi:hypothetical protein